MYINQYNTGLVKVVSQQFKRVHRLFVNPFLFVFCHILAHLYDGL